MIAWSCPSAESIQARCFRSRATADSKGPTKLMYSRDPSRNGISASRSKRRGMIGFLYFSARTHSSLQTEPGRTLSADKRKIMPLHVLMASTTCSSHSSPGRSFRLSSYTAMAGGPAASSSANITAKSFPSTEE